MDGSAKGGKGRMMLTAVKPDILSVAEAEGLKLTRRGHSFWALCPLHSEKTPSFKIDADRQSFYCFGCGEHGDVVEFVKKLHGYSFGDAVSYLGISGDRPVKPNVREKRKRELIKEFREWCDSEYFRLCGFYRRINRLKLKVRTMDEVEAIAELYHQEPLLEYHMDILSGKDEAAKFELYKRSFHGNR